MQKVEGYVLINSKGKYIVTEQVSDIEVDVYTTPYSLEADVYASLNDAKLMRNYLCKTIPHFIHNEGDLNNVWNYIGENDIKEIKKVTMISYVEEIEE